MMRVHDPARARYAGSGTLSVQHEIEAQSTHVTPHDAWGRRFPGALLAQRAWAPQHVEEPRRLRGWRVVVASPAFPAALLFGVTLLLIAAHQGRLLQLFYPIASLLVGVLLYRTHPVHWLAFVCWLMFLSPEVRRLADYFNGTFTQSSPIIVAPLMVAALSCLGVLRYHRVLAQRRAMPLMLAILGVLYGYAVGVVRAGPLPATYAMTQWLLPPLIGFHLLIHWWRYGEFRRVLMRTFKFGALVMGTYGVIEFVVMPPWDVFWLISSQMKSEGDPVPFGIRVASTMNSSGPYAVTAMVCLLFLMADSGKLRAIAACAVLTSLLLTSVRTAWGGLVIGLMFPLLGLKLRMRVRLIGSALALAVLTLPLMSIDKIAEPVLKRVQSIGDLGNDSSFADRSAFYANFLDTALTDIAGQGLGSTGAATKLDSGPRGSQMSVFDSGLMEIPFVLGWPGSLLFSGGVLWLLARAFVCACRIRKDRMASSGVGIGIGLLAMLISANMLTGLTGMFFYISVILPVIGRRAIRQGLAAPVESK
ncbi:O-antigen ligase family protein [Pararobbsia alpina]|uniref:Glucose-6-phosphate isomerase n=1 Tax=Pararobbsia alpina TaxID=621374 RepID=A0A6S7AUI5_9BURK|nr:hypothetical protein [Pararobbsia alpina]CAB3778387.1 hypothetical protein LMG28138_00466 [Pararobbsia alpina]